MPKRHVMTAGRKAALRKAQLASARKRKGRGRSNLKYQVHGTRHARFSPRAKKALKYAAIGAAVGAGIYGGYRAAYVPVYHNTSSQNARKIMREGFRGTPDWAKKNMPKGTLTDVVYFSAGRNKAKMYGNATIKGRMSRRDYYKYSHRDPEYRQPRASRYIRKSDLSHVRGLHMTRVRSNVY